MGKDEIDREKESLVRDVLFARLHQAASEVEMQIPMSPNIRDGFGPFTLTGESVVLLRKALSDIRRLLEWRK